MVKNERDFQDNMFISQYIGKKLYDMNKMTYHVLSEKILEKTGKKISNTYISKILSGSGKGNYENFEAIALTIGLSKDEFQKIFEDAKKAEFEHTTGKNIAEDVPLEEAIKISFRKQGIVDDEEAIKSVKAVMEFLSNKYHNKK